jgi:hypothetical protein
MVEDASTVWLAVQIGNQEEIPPEMAESFTIGISVFSVSNTEFPEK